MNKQYKKMISKCTFMKLDCGTYRQSLNLFQRVSNMLFPFKNQERWKLPAKMYQKGLFIIGDSWRDANRVDFTIEYAKALLDQGLNVIYISSPLVDYEEQRYGVPDRFIDKYELDTHSMHRADLSEEFNPLIFEKGGVISVIQSKPGCFEQEERIEHNKKVNKLLSQIANSDLGKKTPETVVFIEDNHEAFPSHVCELQNVVSLLRGKGFGVVVSCEDTRRYNDIRHTFGGYLFFRMDDPTEEVRSHKFLYEMKPSGSFITRVNERDVKNLNNDECICVLKQDYSSSVNCCIGFYDAPFKVVD